jgi:hypothetical protein
MGGRGAEFWRTRAAPRGIHRTQKYAKDAEMIIAVGVALKEICEESRGYAWPKPDVCPVCGSGSVWGHGYVRGYFDGCLEGVLLRRYRCAQCHCVMRLRPAGYWKRFQASIADIRTSVTERLKNCRYLSSLSRSRQRHWLKALERKAHAYWGDGAGKDLLSAFERLVEMGKTPVSRSI